MTIKTILLCWVLFLMSGIGIAQCGSGSSGSAVLQGRIVGSGGLAARDLRILLRHTESSVAARGPGQVGRHSGESFTDRQGRFRMEGLAHGEYEILVRSDKVGAEDWVRLSSELYKSGMDCLAVVYEQPVVQVRLLNSGGQPYEQGDVAERKVKPHGFMFDWERICDHSNWPRTPQVLVRAVGGKGLSELEAWRSKAAHKIAANLYFSPLKPGKSYALQVIGGGFDGRVQYVSASTDGSAVALEVRAGSSGKVGTLQVDLKDRGRVLGLEKYDFNFRLWVADMDSGLPLISRRQSTQGPSEFELPPGIYRVVLEGRPLFDVQHGTLITQRGAGRAEAIVDIKVGEQQVIELHMQAGGYLDLAIEGQATSADILAAHTILSWAEEGDPRILERSRQVRVVIRRPHFLTETVEYAALSEQGTSGFGVHQHWAWPMGASHESEMLPAGTFEIEATSASGRSIKQMIEIKADATLELILRIPDAD